ncbi:hypothetical protein FKP32DRAFT_884218 [Trametes sanguinea]|nr:hypothetical protein FKP32DRAFT_884218 [Trametes sanguinea]
MQSHRHPRNDTGGQYGAMSRRPIPPDRLCRVIAFGTEPSCDRAGFRTHPRQLCKQHRSEHKALYLAYKNSSAEVDRLLALVDDEPNWEDPTCLTLTALGSAITNRQQFMDAIQEEIRGRIKHQARFIADPDDGHVKWLQLRRNMHEECSQVLEQLKRRQEILKADEARKQEAAQAHVERQRQAAEAEASAIRRQHEMRRLAEERRQREAREEERRRRQEQEQRQECARRMQEAQAEAVARKLADLQHQHQTMFAGAGAIQGVREVQGSHPATSQIPSQQPEHRSLAGHAGNVHPPGRRP